MTSAQELAKKRLLAAALNKLQSLKKTECFDGNDLDSRPTKEQEAVIDAVRRHEASVISVRAGNQGGKSQTAARIFAWLLEGSFPDWTPPPKWNDQVQLLVLGRSFKQLEDSLWRKMESLLTPGTYKIIRQGGVLSKVLHDNGNSILFFSHDNPNIARERVQSFSAEAVWLDELPRTVKLIEELQRRVQAKDGFVLMTYTPKAPAPDIKRFVETMKPPVGVEYRLSALANPIYTEADKKKLIDSLSSFSESYRNTILQGDWMMGEEMVYQFDYDRMVSAPPDYSPAWRHVVSIDPASSGSTGLCLAAEHPSSGHWFIIRAEYLNIKVPTELVEAIEQRIANVNIVRRVYDPHETWFRETAGAAGRTYLAPYKKTERKKELIKNLQEALGSRVFIAPWCQDFIDEISSCYYANEFSDKIAKAQRFHVLDSAQYLVDLLPKYEHGTPQQDWWTELRLGNEKRKQRQQAVKAAFEGRDGQRMRSIRVRKRGRSW
jgi:hypothetical protein